MNNRVVITGMGIYSVIGKNLDEVRNALYLGKSGIIFDPVRKEMGFRSALTGMVERPVLKGVLDRRMRVGLPVQGEYAYLATLEALKTAGIDQPFLDKQEVGILYGNDSSAVPVVDSVNILRNKKDTMMIGSGYIFQSMNSTVSMNLSVIFKLRGINFTVSGACASGSHAIGIGYLMIRRRPGNKPGVHSKLRRSECFFCEGIRTHQSIPAFRPRQGWTCSQWRSSYYNS